MFRSTFSSLLSSAFTSILRTTSIPSSLEPLIVLADFELVSEVVDLPDFDTDGVGLAVVGRLVGLAVPGWAVLG